ncbi:MAG: hypothetical protein Q9201_002693 [Fulgogasparrea decipioides]
MPQRVTFDDFRIDRLCFGVLHVLEPAKQDDACIDCEEQYKEKEAKPLPTFINFVGTIGLELRDFHHTLLPPLWALI